jgi:hypothetical protein
MGYESRETSTSGYDLEPLWVALDTVGFRDIGRQALRATETIAQSVRSRNRQYRAVAMREDDLASFHRRTATDRAQVAMRQFGEVLDLIDEIRRDPEWRSEVLPRLDAALGDDGRGWESVSQLETEAGRALLDLDDLSGKTTQQFLAAMRPYDPGGGAPPEGSFDDLFLGRFRHSVHRGEGICGILSFEPVEGEALEGREPFELARAICVETGFGLLAIAAVASTTVPNSRGYHFAALTRLLPTVLSASTIAAEAPLPDLVPIVDPQSFCVENRIEFAVKNIGPTTAGRSLTAVAFGQHLKRSLPTQELRPGHDVSLQADIPPECAPTCEITITVDADNDVAEADKGNNVVQVTCPGPSPSPTTATTSSR